MKKRARTKPKARNRTGPKGGADRRLDRRPADPKASALRGASASPSRTAPAAIHATAIHAYEADDRQALTLLLLPFLIMTLSLGLSQTLKPTAGWLETARSSPPQAIAVTPVPVAAAPQIQRETLAVAIATPPLTMPTSPPAGLSVPPVIALPTPPFSLAAFAPPVELAYVTVPTLPLSLPTTAPQIALAIPAPPLDLPREAPTIPPLPASSYTCVPAVKAAAAITPASGGIGMRLAMAARAQTDGLVIYNPAYRQISYPMGDIPSLYGTCSDVVIRAYRAVGVDLQELVQKARIGRGDPNIDHRRTETLRVFFSRYGESLAVSRFGEDYKPGDIVTYYRPFSRVSRAHIAIVSDVIGPSGKPMIVHNRGWGPQLEDALFADRITGHYRFAGPSPSPAPPKVAETDGPARLREEAAQRSRSTLRPRTAYSGARTPDVN